MSRTFVAGLAAVCALAVAGPVAGANAATPPASSVAAADQAGAAAMLYGWQAGAAAAQSGFQSGAAAAESGFQSGANALTSLAAGLGMPTPGGNLLPHAPLAPVSPLG